MQSLFCTSPARLSQSPQDPKIKFLFAIVLSISLLLTGCNSQWLSTAIADLPVLTQMGLNIATLVATLQTGQQVNPKDATAVQTLSSEIARDLNLLQGLYNQYKTSPSADTLQKIQSTITLLSNNLPSLLQSADISDPALSTRVTAGVNLILTTVSSFAALMPQTALTASQKTPGLKIVVPNPAELKKQWNLQVCAPSPNFQSSASACVVR